MAEIAWREEGTSQKTERIVQRFASGKRQLLESLKESANSVVAKYLREGGTIIDYNPELIEWSFNSAPESSEVEIKYAGAPLASALQSQVEAHPFYVAATQTYTRMHGVIWQSFESSLKRAEIAELELKELKIGLPEMAATATWWVERIARLVQEVRTAAVVLGMPNPE